MNANRKTLFAFRPLIGQVQRWSTLKTSVVVLIGILVAVAGATLGMTAIHLAFQRTPQSIASLQFKGFIALPSPAASGLWSVMDYLTIEGRNLYVASIKPGAVFRVPLDGTSLPLKSDIALIPGKPSAHGVVFDPSGRVGFISRSGVNVVDIFNVATLQITKSIAVAEGADGIFFDPFNKLIYAVSGDAKMATLIDPFTQSKVMQINLGGKPEFAVFDASTNLIYQNLKDSNEIAVVDLAKRAVVDRWPLLGCDGPSGLEFDKLKRRLLIACSGNDTLLVMNADTRRVVSSVTIGAEPDSVAYDPEKMRVYSTGKQGVLSVVQQDADDTYRNTGNVTLEYGAHTLAFDQLTRRIYVGYVNLFTEPRLAVFDAP